MNRIWKSTALEKLRKEWGKGMIFGMYLLNEIHGVKTTILIKVMKVVMKK